jgi:DNA mismatch repair protein MutS
MAGKSVYIRQVALITLMAQIGSFVPAEKATIGLVDRIFVRSGASDIITSGLSTFMVEMVETAQILHHATSQSLIVMDEIGRGTSTYDGISIAWAIAEYLVTNKEVHAKTLFATHYHELQDLEEKYPEKIKNYFMKVEQQNDKPIFLHTLEAGKSSHSFGIAVAKLAGLPQEIIEKAHQLLATMEKRTGTTPPPLHSHLLINHICAEIEEIDLYELTPLEALNKLASIKDKLKIARVEKHTLSTN